MVPDLWEPMLSSTPRIVIDYPTWVSHIELDRTFASDEDRMRLAIRISRDNVEHKTGGPFGAAIFERNSGKLVAVGMNSVVRLHNCTLHGEMVAFMMAQQKVKSFTLSAPGMPEHDLFTSCEPCAMCLGAALWSGVKRIVMGAARDDASRSHHGTASAGPARAVVVCSPRCASPAACRISPSPTSVA